jgi:hypothetical protein
MMRAFLAGLIFAMSAAGAQAQFVTPFVPYEPTPAYLGLGANAGSLHCDANPAPYPYNRDVRRGQQANEPPAPAPGCPAR